MKETLFGKRLRNLRLLRKMSQQDLANELNKWAIEQNSKNPSKISKSMISRWENGNTDPQMFYVRLITSYFKVDPNAFINEKWTPDDELVDSSINNKLMVNSPNILSIYNYLNPTRQQKVYNYANHQLEEQNNNVIKLSDYTDNVEHTEIVYGAVSAGTGQYLDHEQPEQVVVRGSAPDHDFAVKVVGNSMEPTFNDGQIVYVNKLVDESEIRNNQFVIAEVNGDAFIKKLSFSDDYVKLISLNPNYDDIIIHDYDDFLIRGIVVI